MEENYLKEGETQLTKALLQLFEQHGVICVLDEDTIIFPEQRISSQLWLHKHPSTVGSVFKLDVILTIEEDRSIIESSVGIGEDDNEAAIDAFEQFVVNSFHVLLASFFTTEYNNHINVEEWTIGGQQFDVIFSNVCIRGQAPQPMPLQWIEKFVGIAQQQTLTSEIHWVRLFYALSNNELMTCEVLLDNDDWMEVQEKAKRISLPHAEKYLSLRMFFVLKPKN